MQKNRIYVKPLYWGPLENGDNCTFLFGTTSNNKTIYMKIILRNYYRVPANYNLESLTDLLILDNNKKDILIRTSSNLDLPKLKQDSRLFSFLKPYDWIQVDQTQEFQDKYTKCAYELTTYEIYMRSVSIDLILTTKYLFWSISYITNPKLVSSNSVNRNVSPKRRDEPVRFNSMNSIPVDDKIYALYLTMITGNYKCTYLVSDRELNLDNVVCIKAKEETEIFAFFFDFVSLVLPDFLISFNSERELIPKMLKRMQHTEYICPLDFKVIGEPLDIIKRGSDAYFELLGINSIDMYNYITKFNPYLTESGNDMSFKDLVQSINICIDNKLSNPRSYQKKFCFKDQIDNITYLADYVIENNIIRQLYHTCNNLEITCQTLLSGSDDIISSGLSDNNKYKRRKSKIYKKGRSGVYLNCYLYMFYKLYQETMELSDSRITSEIGKKLRGSPPNIILSTYFSEHINRSSLKLIIKKELKPITELKSVLFLGKYYLISTEKLSIDKSWLQLIDRNITYTQ